MRAIPSPAPRWLLVATTLLLFVVWSNSFIAIGYLLGADAAARRFDWRGLTAARFVPAALTAGLYCLLARRRESAALLRAEWPRLVASGLLAVPCYNFALYYGQQHGVPAPIASITTALAPLFILALSAALGERLTARKAAGFLLALAGVALISQAKSDAGAGALPGTGTGGPAYAGLIAITALAPLSWSIHSVLSKPIVARHSPLVWTYLAIVAGTIAVLPFTARSTFAAMAGLDPAGLGALLFLAIPCTVVGFALWAWLLSHLPASSVGLTVFLNPPLTTGFKYLLSRLFPATFGFAILPLEWLGGAVAIAGLALAVTGARRQRGDTRRQASPRRCPGDTLVVP